MGSRPILFSTDPVWTDYVSAELVSIRSLINGLTLGDDSLAESIIALEIQMNDANDTIAALQADLIAKQAMITTLQSDSDDLLKRCVDKAEKQAFFAAMWPNRVAVWMKDTTPFNLYSEGAVKALEIYILMKPTAPCRLWMSLFATASTSPNFLYLPKANESRTLIIPSPQTANVAGSGTSNMVNMYTGATASKNAATLNSIGVPWGLVPSDNENATSTWLLENFTTLDVRTSSAYIADIKIRGVVS